MEVKHERGGDMIIDLDHTDEVVMREFGYSMKSKGLDGTTSKTWVKLNSWVTEPRASIDEASDVHVYINETHIHSMPLRINIIDVSDHEAEKVHDYYFGELGGIVIQAVQTGL